MSTPYVRAPHKEGSSGAGNHPAPNAALLIDFDNVTMGMRSDLSRELKALLNSDIIKGKVAVQRAYADWRRYPQYIVPLSEASIDLIFAPAYGSSKKNATDIRMAIDGIELVFTRPEIGTYILLTGDSDFSSLVLKLKEYGKYVIGVGIQESSSDILVQNCDEYYSYTNLAGLRKSTDADSQAVDPWLLVEKAVERMESRNDVMRSDRLKQVMLEIDSGFDESEYGFSKFSRFLTEASSKGLVELRRMENGQYEVRLAKGGGSGPSRGPARDSAKASTSSRSPASTSSSAPAGRSSGDGGSPSTSAARGRGRATRSRGRATRSGSGSAGEAPAQEAEVEKSTSSSPTRSISSGGGDPLKAAYALLTDAIETVFEDRGITSVRDSDVKRKMLERDRSFDEAELGFSKFSLFLQQADEHGIVELRQTEGGNYEVTLPGISESRPDRSEDAATGDDASGIDVTGDDATGREAARSEAPQSHHPPSSEPTDSEPSSPEPEEVSVQKEEGTIQKEEESESVVAAGAQPSTRAQPTRSLGPRRGERTGRRGRTGESAPPILEGQIVGSVTTESGGGSSKKSGGVGSTEDPGNLGLPTDAESVVRYLTNSYKGVGEKTAEALVEELGPDLFQILQDEPSRVRDVLPANRADQLLDAWNEDLDRRKTRGDASDI